MKKTKEDILKELKENVFSTITFKKVDGEERTIIGTTNKNVMKGYLKEEMVEGKTAREESDEIVTVFCPEEPGYWRRFKIENLIKVEKYD